MYVANLVESLISYDFTSSYFNYINIINAILLRIPLALFN